MDYEIEYHPNGTPARMWWVPSDYRPKCACGRRATYIHHEGNPGCAECRKVRIGYYFKGRNPDCRWCEGRGCLACPPREGER